MHNGKRVEAEAEGDDLAGVPERGEEVLPEGQRASKRIWVSMGLCKQERKRGEFFTFVDSAESTFANFIDLWKSDTFTRNFDLRYEFAHVGAVHGDTRGERVSG